MTEAMTAGGAFHGRPTGRFLGPISINNVLEREGLFERVPVSLLK